MGNDRTKHQRNSTEVILFILAVVATCISLDFISGLVIFCLAMSMVTALGSVTYTGTEQDPESMTNNLRICRFSMGLLCVILSVFSSLNLHDDGTPHCNGGPCKYEYAALVRGCVRFTTTVLWLVYSVRMFTLAFGYLEEDQDSKSTRYSHDKASTIQNDAAKVTSTEMARNWIVIV